MGSRPSAPQSPNCKGCGTYLEPGTGPFCAVCAQKPMFQAPKATMEIGEQPDPAYRDVPPSGVAR